MAKFYVEVKEEKKWIFPETEADNVEAASQTALDLSSGQDFDSIEKFVSHARVIN